MNGMKLSTVFVFLVITHLCFSQTREIAYKSHSGNMHYFKGDGDGNFGLVEPISILDSIVKINDSTIVQCVNNTFKAYSYDTIINSKIWLNPYLNLDSIQNQYHQNVVFIGFEKPVTKQKAPPTQQRRRNSTN